MGVSAQFVLEGTWYALKQTGKLLHDAVDLYDRGRFGTATGPAMQAREELGKARILLDLRDQVNAGRTLTVAEIRKEIEDHLGKQTAALLSVKLTAPHGSGLEKLMRQAFSGAGSEENVLANEELADVVQRMAKRTPDDRRELRERALYVDPRDDGTEWSRPILFDHEEAQDHLLMAVNDYSIMKRSLEGAPSHAGVRAALGEWSQRPQLPEPRWPQG